MATSDTPRGIWLGASYALGRNAATDQPYPHVCGITLTGRVTGVRYRLTRRDCAACREATRLTEVA